MLYLIIPGGEQGIFRRTAVRLRVATLLDRGLSNSPPDCFHRLCRPSLFESLAYLFNKETRGTAFAVPRISWRRARDSNPRNRFGGLHDFQSCSFDQLGQLSIRSNECALKREIYYKGKPPEKQGLNCFSGGFFME